MQSVISFALKTHLEIRLGICIYETSLLHWPDDYVVSHQVVPPIFYNKIAPVNVPEMSVTQETCEAILVRYALINMKLQLPSTETKSSIKYA